MGKKGGGAEQENAGAFCLPSARVKAIAQQDREMGSLNNDAVERISTAAHELLQELVRGGLKAAREREAEASAGKGKGNAGPVTIQPEDICAFVASEERLGFLRRVTEAASQQAGFLEGYRARNKEAAGATSKKRHRAKAKALAGLAGAEEEEEGEDGGGEYEDEEVEEAFLKDGKGSGGGGGGVAEKQGAAGKSAALSLDEDYDDDDKEEENDDEG